MILELADVIPRTVVKSVLAELEGAAYVDGRTTAGPHARQVKANEQIERGSPVDKALNSLVVPSLVGHATFVRATQPKAVLPLLFARYTKGMAYGRHVDDAILSGSPPFRTDVSFTLFLSEPADYEGGELVIQEPGFERGLKPPAGHLVLYPSTTLHEVREVTQGVRHVAVGWVHSLIRSAAQRELLFDLHQIAQGLAGREDTRRERDRLAKVQANLMRMWAEV